MQVKNKSCSNALMHGGYPDTTQSTALTADWYGARMRSCYDGVFYPGWLYGGQTVSQVAAAHGWDYVKWGCVGFHFSGDWDPTQSYVLEVQQHLANRTWAGF
jgi:hypothetical protein